MSTEIYRKSVGHLSPHDRSGFFLRGVNYESACRKPRKVSQGPHLSLLRTSHRSTSHHHYHLIGATHYQLSDLVLSVMSQTKRVKNEWEEMAFRSSINRWLVWLFKRLARRTQYANYWWSIFKERPGNTRIFEPWSDENSWGDLQRKLYRLSRQRRIQFLGATITNLATL